MQFLDDDGHRYRLQFHHERYQPPLAIPTKAPKHSPYHGGIVYVQAKTVARLLQLTDGEITKMSGKVEAEPKLVSETQVFCSLTDRFDKPMGREYALWRLLAHAWPTPNKMWELTLKAYAKSGARRPDPTTVKRIAAEETGITRV